MPVNGPAAPPRFYRDALDLLKRSRIPFLIGGSSALCLYTGISRDTKDLDVFLRRRDCEPVLRLFSEKGYKTAWKARHWLAKIWRGSRFVDLIFSSGNGLCEVDDAWFEFSEPGRLFGVRARFVPVEEMIWTKAFIMERGRYDGADIAHLLKARADRLDWGRLLGRFGERGAVLLSHLILFRFIFPRRGGNVPPWVLSRLFSKSLEPASQRARRLCRGTLLSFGEYLDDIEAGERDARLYPEGKLSPDEVFCWTLVDKEDPPAGKIDALGGRVTRG